MADDRRKLLIIGGYGTFGGRLARLLADEPALKILIAGRSLHKAVGFIRNLSGRTGFKAEEFDRNGDVAGQLCHLAPDIVVDASGPWQEYGNDRYRVARAAIDNGAHYLDLADGTDFVCNIGQLDERAKRNGVFALAGASTSPVLTAAVVRELGAGLDVIESVDIGIVPSPFARMGKSVVRAISSYAGKPVEFRQDEKTEVGHAFADSRRFTIAPPGSAPLPTMTFSLIDVPDLCLLDCPGVPVRGVWFGVSAQPAVYFFLLRLLAKGVEVGIFSSLRPLAGLMHFAMNRLSWGRHRGGMFVKVCGSDPNGKKVKRSWHLIAEGDTGPNVPTLAAFAIIKSCLDGRCPIPGARPATHALTIDDYKPMFEKLQIETGTRESPLPAESPLFRQILGDAWSRVPTEVSDLHGAAAGTKFSGRADVSRGRSLLSRIVAKLVGFPDAARDIPVTVQIEKESGREIWNRNFDGHCFSSQMTRGNGRMSGLVCERFGPVKLGMALIVDNDELRYESVRWNFFGLPMPRFLMPTGTTYETADDGKFRFHVEVNLFLAGHLVSYSGWLTESD